MAKPIERVSSFDKTTIYVARSPFTAGLSAGMFAAAVLAAFAILHSSASGGGLAMPLRLTAGTFLGVEALVGGAAAVLGGLALHFLVYGVVFGLLFAGISGKQPSGLGRGLMFGAAAWLVMTFLLLPFLNPVMRDRMALFPGFWFLEHLLYGACLAMAYGPRRVVRVTATETSVRRGETG